MFPSQTMSNHHVTMFFFGGGIQRGIPRQASRWNGFRHLQCHSDVACLALGHYDAVLLAQVDHLFSHAQNAGPLKTCGGLTWFN